MQRAGRRHRAEDRRRVVDRGDVDGDRLRRRQSIRIGDGDVEAVGAVEIGVRGVGVGAVGEHGGGAVGRAAGDGVGGRGGNREGRAACIGGQNEVSVGCAVAGRHRGADRRIDIDRSDQTGAHVGEGRVGRGDRIADFASIDRDAVDITGFNGAGKAHHIDLSDGGGESRRRRAGRRIVAGVVGQRADIGC